MTGWFTLKPISCSFHRWTGNPLKPVPPCRRKPYRHLFNSHGVYSGTFCKEHTPWAQKELVEWDREP